MTVACLHFRAQPGQRRWNARDVRRAHRPVQ